LHTVASGETLFRIADRYGLTMAEVATANNITDPTLIFAGQQLIIPGADPQMLALDLPEMVESVSVDPLVLTEGRTGSFRVRVTEAVQVSSRFLERDVPVLAAGDGSYLMLVGVPIFTPAGVYPLEMTLTNGTDEPATLTLNIQVLGGTYRSERVNLTGERANLVNINVENAERQILSDVMSNFTTTAYLDGPLSLPAAASMTSPFGSRRAYNGSDFDRFHSGADFAGAAGSPVLAPAAGMVVLADALNICGVTTVIDHGLGIYTAYCHQSELYVQPGDLVSTGQVIGLVGATGRTTGAHLHWELWVNGVPVDPMQWVRQSFF
jgi:murein DD-endopeptidase MepM/ murein hydrolase activator NlpD